MKIEDGQSVLFTGDSITDCGRAPRWLNDVIAHHPNWLSVMIGINDILRQFDNAADLNQVTIDRCETIYRSVRSLPCSSFRQITRR
jgi:acyl-CoA thioesterase I